jgi:hypothetical protein
MFVPMREQPYEAEHVLQALLAEHPEILAGDETGETTAWLLVRREAGIADREDGADRWSLDHLFLDQAGVPTLVEVKRGSDTRVRREVVAQMLDYAANATAHWNVASVRAWFEEECERARIDPEERLRSVFEIEDAESYWALVKTNLAAEKIRLVFVADDIPSELRRIVEFLNRQMTDTEVFAIEVKQYVDTAGERQTIVPRVLGQTEAAKATKAGGTRVPARRWDRQSLLAEVARLHGGQGETVVRDLLEWGERRDDVRIDYGTGAQHGTARIRFVRDGIVFLIALYVTTSGEIYINFEAMRTAGQEPFATSRAARDELRQRIREAVPAANIREEEVRLLPKIEFAALADPAARRGLIGAVEWAADEAWRARSGSLTS